jgi:hypothetical protein
MAISILGSLIAAAIGATLTPLWQRFLHPFIVENLWEPTKLAKEYKGRLDFGNGPRHEISVRVNKKGYGIEGRLRFIEGRHSGKEYFVKGRYYHGMLTFTYWAVDQVSTSQGSATFQRLRDGELFLGYFAYYSQEKDFVDTVKCELRPA